MMKARTRKLLSLLLTLAMVAGMFVLPASAEVTEEGGVFTLDFTAETDNLGFQEGTNELTLTETKAAGTAKVDADSTKYFTIGLNVKVTKGAEKATFGDDADYQPTAYANMGANIGNSNVKGDKSCITFTTINAKAKIKVWWGRNGVKKGIGVFSGESKDSTASLYAETELASSAIATYITEITAPTAGHVYAVGAAGDAAKVQIYKVEVTDLPADPNAVDITMGQTKASVLEGGTITLSAEKAPADATLAWTSGNTSIATVEENEDDTCTVTGVSAGTATITATVSKDGQDPISGECEVTVYGTKDGVLHFLSTDSNLTVPTTTDERIAVGKNNSVSGYAFELYGGPSVGTESGKTGNYKGTTLKHVIKLTGSSKGFSFMAPDAGTLTLYFADAENGATVKYAEDDGELTKSTAVSSTQPFTLTTKAGSTYKVEKGDNKCWATHFIWKASDYECEHTWSETAVTVDGKDVYYCTNPVCLETKAAEQPKDMTNKTVAGQSVSYDGQAHEPVIKVAGPDGKEITGATVTFANKPTGGWINHGAYTVNYTVKATGYNDLTGSVNFNITKAKVTLGLAMPTEVAQAPVKGQDNRVTFTLSGLPDGAKATLSCSNGKTIADLPAEAGNGEITVTVPDKTEDYEIQAVYAGDNNHTSDTIKRAFHTREFGAQPRVYVLTADSAVITIGGQEVASGTKVEVNTQVTVTANAAPEGQEFDKWVITGPLADRFDEQTKSKSVTFSMPAGATSFKATYKDKTTESGPANKTALVGLLNTANEFKAIPEEAENAADVDKGVDWVKPADMITFTTAIDAAQRVSSNENSTQAEVDKAVADLDKAIEDFQAAWGKGTKSSGSSEPTTTTKVLDANTMAEEDHAGKADTVVADYFTIKWGGKGKVQAGSATFEGDTYAGTKRVHMGGKTETLDARVINFTTTGANASVKIWYKTGKTSGNNPDGTPKVPKARNIAVFKGSMDTIVGQSSHTADDEDKTFIATYTLADPATYSVGILGDTCFIYKIEVTDTAAGGDTPVPDTAARKALKDAVALAEKAVEKVKTSTDGSEYPSSVNWITERAKTAYKNAIALAKAKANSPKFDDTALTAAKTALDEATARFETAQQPGTKTGGDTSSGGGSSVPSSGGGTTVTNPDGSKTNTKTNKTTGTVTETTTWPNGDKTVVVTEKDGTVTETVTKKDGTKSETVTKPDGSVKATVTDAKGIKTETATSASGDTTAKVTLPNRVKKAVVTIPVKNVTEGTVAVIVAADGSEKVIKTSVAGEAGLELLVDKNVSVKIKDNAKKFQDIADDYWAKGAVDFASSREIFKGTTEVTFSPMDLVDRGMMATVLFRLADAKAEGENSFFDVPDGNWYTDAVTWANRSGVVTGYADGTFGPADAVTREQMATMLFRYAKVMGMDVTVKGDVSKFGDVNDVSSWASEAMTWCVGVGLINGVADPATGVTLSPAKTASRAEVATIMQRMVKLMMQ